MRKSSSTFFKQSQYLWIEFTLWRRILSCKKWIVCHFGWKILNNCYTEMLIGSTSRYIAGRNAVQTVYWRITSDERGGKMFKHGRVFFFSEKSSADRYPPAHCEKDCVCHGSPGNQKTGHQVS
jgi:hypothetical protein